MYWSRFLLHFGLGALPHACRPGDWRAHLALSTALFHAGATWSAEPRGDQGKSQDFSFLSSSSSAPTLSTTCLTIQAIWRQQT